MIIMQNCSNFDITYHRSNNTYTIVLAGLNIGAGSMHIINCRAKAPICPNFDRHTTDEIISVFARVYTYVKNNSPFTTAQEMSDKVLDMMRIQYNDSNYEWANEYDEGILNAYSVGNVGDNSTDAKATVMSLEKTMTKMLDFFSEFSFVPSFRFLDTLSRKTSETATAYILNYFKLSGNASCDEVAEKMQSMEFSNIMDSFFANVTPTNNCVNSRLKVYFGSAGTGKTTKALEEASGNCIICNNDTAPSDLMEDFTFDDGKATFHPSALALAMENGDKIVLDEINLLPFSSLRFLQGITDGKSEFLYKGNVIHINDGFEIIGTMNLNLGGMTYGLPEPLVDRCSDIEEYVMTGKKLASFFKQN